MDNPDTPVVQSLNLYCESIPPPSIELTISVSPVSALYSRLPISSLPITIHLDLRFIWCRNGLVVPTLSTIHSRFLRLFGSRFSTRRWHDIISSSGFGRSHSRRLRLYVPLIRFMDQPRSSNTFSGLIRCGH